MKIKSFSERSFTSFTNGFSEQIRSEIAKKGKEYILNVNENDYKVFLVKKHMLIPLEVNKDSEVINEPKIVFEFYENRYGGGQQEREVYVFTIIYSFIGTPLLFSLNPSKRALTTYEIDVNERNNTVSFDLKVYEKDPEKFKQEKNRCYRDAFINMTNLNKEVDNWNKNLGDIVNSIFNSLKEKYLKENEFFEAINVRINPETKSIFNDITVKRKIIPQIPKITKKEYSKDPFLSMEMYDDILKVLYDSGKNMEKKPSLYIGKDEEGLRDQFIFILETRYEGVTATNETFNRSGRTDILLKYAKDSSNIFVAECKFWNGTAEFNKAINQLFERYLTWRDSKVALIIFVRNKDFSKILSIIKDVTPKHSLYLKSNGERGETSFSYIFCLPQDRDKEVYLEIMLFHYDK